MKNSDVEVTLWVETKSPGAGGLVDNLDEAGLLPRRARSAGAGAAAASRLFRSTRNATARTTFQLTQRWMLHVRVFGFDDTVVV